MGNPDLSGMKAGDAHYMAYVGPPRDYDIMAATQFSLLTMMGLRSTAKVLDVGCGSLRAGRLLIPYLDKGNYFGIEPNKWLVQEGIEQHFGESILEVKMPRFAHNENFDASEFNTKFDVVLAQSVLSHTGRDLAATALRQLGSVLAEGGVAYITFGIRPQPRPAGQVAPQGWVYPELVRFQSYQIEEMAAESGLQCARLRWFHPRQAWYAFAHDAASLPPRIALEQGGYSRSFPKSANRGNKPGKAPAKP